MSWNADWGTIWVRWAQYIDSLSFETAAFMILIIYFFIGLVLGMRDEWQKFTRSLS